MGSLLKLPSPAMAVAFTALFLVLGGTAVALRGKNSVDSGDIKNGQVRTTDIRNDDLRGTDVRTNSLTGTDIKESTLGTVASAKRADAAGTADTAAFATNAGNATSAGSVGGMRIQKIYLEENDAGPNVTPITVGGIRITPDCTGGVPNFDAANASGLGAQFFVNGGFTAGDQFSGQDEDFTSGDSGGLSAGGSDTGNGTAVVIFANRQTTTLHYGWNRTGTSTPNACAIFGYAVIG